MTSTRLWTTTSLTIALALNFPGAGMAQDSSAAAALEICSEEVQIPCLHPETGEEISKKKAYRKLMKSLQKDATAAEEAVTEEQPQTEAAAESGSADAAEAPDETAAEDAAAADTAAEAESAESAETAPADEHSEENVAAESPETQPESTEENAAAADSAPAEQEAEVDEAAEQSAGEAEEAVTAEDAPASDGDAPTMEAETTEADAAEPETTEEAEAAQDAAPAETETETETVTDPVDQAGDAETAEPEQAEETPQETSESDAGDASQPAAEEVSEAAQEEAEEAAQTDDVRETSAEEQAEAEAAAAEEAASAAAASGDAEVVESSEATVSEDEARSSAEEFETTAAGQKRNTAQANAAAAAAAAAAAKDDDDDKLLKALGIAAGAALGAYAIGQVLDGGERVVSNTGDRVVVERDGRYRVIKDDDTLLRRPGNEVKTERYSDGSTRTIVTEPDGAQTITVRASDGRVLRRLLTLADGSEVILFDDTQQYERVDVKQLADTTARDFDYTSTDAEDLRAALAAAQGDVPDRRFSLNQIRNIDAVRKQVPVIALDAINFETGSAVIRPEEAEELSELGNAMRNAIADNPRQVFLVEGHTDTVGRAAYNLALSDRRAESVALALTEYFDVPPANMIVQGYGEADLKIRERGDVRANRRAAVRNITPLLTDN